ncbi:LacI family DNA-binding transcriptional regulator [Nocardia carnea]|uniref:LacI family DNA-binding transcriptional regulator n=1 Tax=Nocardia carnea TaxID=37328 RepID=UPI002454FAE4|nr:LacI family DNA-binding transcriptional regulator [Nocardia carnea]
MKRQTTRSAKRVTSSDVAFAAGVSRTTVSFVLNNRADQSISEETRQRVLDAAQRLEYRPNASGRALAAGRSDIVLLSIPDLPMGAGINRFVEELAAALAAHDLTLVTHLAGAHGTPLPDVCATVNASAVVGFSPFEPETAAALRRAGAEVVLPEGHPDEPIMEPVGRLQAEHLIGRGHRRLGYALPGHPNLRAMAQERLLGAQQACAEAGLEPPAVRVVNLDIIAATEAVQAWTRDSVSGVCAFDDDTALAVLAGLRETGRSAPADLAVIGADDIPAAALAGPPLTTVVFDLRSAGRRRAEAVVSALIGGPPQSSPVSGRPYIIERRST